MRNITLELAVVFALAMSTVACTPKIIIPQSLANIKENVAQIDSITNARYGWEPQDSTYNHSVDTLVANIMELYEAGRPEQSKRESMGCAVQQQTYDDARKTWSEFKCFIDADKYKEALDFYLADKPNGEEKNACDFIIYLKHSTQRYVFFSQVVRPLMQEYKGDAYAVEEYINILYVELAMEKVSIALQADNTGYVPDVYPNVVRDLGTALASIGRFDEARNLFYDLIDGVYGLSGSALLANYVASDYIADLYLIEGKKDDAIANWNRLKDAVEMNIDDYNPEDVEFCLSRIEQAIEELR